MNLHRAAGKPSPGGAGPGRRAAAAHIESTAEPGHTRLRIEGDLDMDSVLRFRDAAFTQVGERPPALLLDLSAAPFVDTTGLSTLVTIARVAQMVQVPVRVLPSPHLRRVLQVTGLIRVLPLVADTP